MTQNCISAAVLGGAGRMGQRIISLIEQTAGITLGAALEKTGHPLIGHDIQEYTGIKGPQVKLTDNLKAILPQTDVLIDFSDVRSTLAHLDLIIEENKPLVLGTTGFSPSEADQLQSKLKHIPCVFAPNMSIGINLMLKLVSQTAQILKNDYDVEIIEAHHRLKKDAPSGTALALAQAVARSLQQDLEKVATYSRKGLIGERKPQEIGIQCLRAGDIVGEHTVLFAGVGERIEFTHRAHTRDTFASGAIKAAIWVANQAPGLYSMQDVLGFEDFQ